MKRKHVETDHHVAYAVGHVEAWLEIYAKSIQSPGPEFTARVATLLLAQTGGTQLGTEHHLSSLPRHSTKRHQALESMEVARRSPRHSSRKGHKRTMSAAARKRISQARKRWWRDLKPIERKRMLVKLREAKAKAAA